MSIPFQIHDFISGLPEAKQADVLFLHKQIQELMPGCKLWFLDGINNGKVIANPNIGYGQHTIKYANGSTREFYRIGISPNKTGISIYIMGLPNNKILEEKFSSRIGKATVSGYCVKLKTLENVDSAVLHEIIQFGANLGY